MKRLLILALCAPTLAFAEEITIGNLVRAETDTMFRATMAGYKTGVGELVHEREPVSAKGPQPIIRANQDTLYSAAVLDLSKPARITLPEADGRFQSMLVINQDHYSYAETSPGSYALTQEGGGHALRFPAVPNLRGRRQSGRPRSGACRAGWDLDEWWRRRTVRGAGLGPREP